MKLTPRYSQATPSSDYETPFLTKRQQKQSERNKSKQAENLSEPTQSLNQENCVQLLKPRVFCVVKQELSPQDFENPIQVTFLNRVVRIALHKNFAFRRSGLKGGKEETKVQSLSRVDRLISLAVEHFEIKLSFTEGVFLLDALSKEVVWEDSQLFHQRSYFLFFTRRGYHLTKEKLLTAKSFEISLLDSQIFTRGDREFRIKQSLLYDEGLVHDLFINHVKGVVDGFACPLLHCGKVFKKSGDLSLHFMTETGKKQFQCRKCGHSFYRRTDLKSHNTCPCEPLSDHKEVNEKEQPQIKEFSAILEEPYSNHISSGETTNIARDSNSSSRRALTTFSEEPALRKRENKSEENCIGFNGQTAKCLHSIIERQLLQNSVSQKMLQIMRMSGHRGEQLTMTRVDLCYNIIFTGRLLQILKQSLAF